MRPSRFISLKIMYSSDELYKFLSTVSSLVTDRLKFLNGALHIEL